MASVTIMLWIDYDLFHSVHPSHWPGTKSTREKQDSHLFISVFIHCVTVNILQCLTTLYDAWTVGLLTKPEFGLALTNQVLLFF